MNRRERYQQMGGRFSRCNITEVMKLFGMLPLERNTRKKLYGEDGVTSWKIGTEQSKSRGGIVCGFWSLENAMAVDVS